MAWRARTVLIRTKRGMNKLESTIGTFGGTMHARELKGKNTNLNE